MGQAREGRELQRQRSVTPPTNTPPPPKKQDVSNTGLDDHGVQEVCEGLKKNASVVALSLARNNFTAKVGLCGHVVWCGVVWCDVGTNKIQLD